MRVVVPAKLPDLDKLVRAVMDGLTRGGAFRADAQVVYVDARKDFAGGRWDPDGPAGVPRAIVALSTFEHAVETGLWPGETLSLFQEARA